VCLAAEQGEYAEKLYKSYRRADTSRCFRTCTWFCMQSLDVTRTPTRLGSCIAQARPSDVRYPPYGTSPRACLPIYVRCLNMSFMLVAATGGTSPKEQQRPSSGRSRCVGCVGEAHIVRMRYVQPCPKPDSFSVLTSSCFSSFPAPSQFSRLLACRWRLVHLPQSIGRLSETSSFWVNPR